MTQNFINEIRNATQFDLPEWISNISSLPSSISTYGAIIIPFNIELVEQESQVQTNPKETNKFMGKIKSALHLSNVNLPDSVKNNKNVKILAEYMQDKRNINKLGSAFGIIGSKFSGIAVVQALIDGKITSKEALDYLFMGFAPAIGIQGSLMGYSGLNQIKDALRNGHIDVGAFISGFRRTLKGATDFKDMLTKKDSQTSANVIEIDLTLSHNESYQSETPDRRVQSGQSLNEYIHNMPETFSINCALQEGRRYSKAEFTAIMKTIRDRKDVVSLVLGDDIFDNLVLTDYSPSIDNIKSGMDYSLSFKKVIRSDIDTNTEVTIQQAPEFVSSENSVSSTGNLGGTSGNKSNNGDSKNNFSSGKTDVIDKDQFQNMMPQVDSDGSIGSTIYNLKGVPYSHAELLKAKDDFIKNHPSFDFLNNI